MLLNLAVRHMDSGEAYVEVGTWRGLSAIGAAAGNPDRPIFVCDNFSKLGGTRRALEANLRAHGLDRQVRVFEGDYRGFLRSAPWRPSTIGVFFYDGAHHWRHQLRALELVGPSLADGALVVIDDTDDLPVRAANELFRSRVPALEPVLDVRSPEYKHAHWWNGIQCFRWRADAPPGDLPVPWRSYLPRLLLWNRGVVYGQRAAHYARLAGWGLASALLPSGSATKSKEPEPELATPES